MVLPLLGIVAAVLSIGGLAVAVSHLIHPVSIGVGFVTAVGVLLYVQRIDGLNVFSRDWMNTAVDVGVAVAFGFLAYRVLAWVLVAAGFAVSLVVIGLLFVGGTAAVWAVVQFALGELIE